MTTEQREAVEICKTINAGMIYFAKDRECEEYASAIKTVLSLIKEQQEEIEKRDNAVRKIINRLDNDYKRITETKRDKNKFPNYLDDYTKCRLKAYRTKTKEIKEYIEQQYFANKVNSRKGVANEQARGTNKKIKTRQ